MDDLLATELIQLGLTATEAQVYLALIRNGPMAASAVAVSTGLARTAVYPTLGALVDKGLADAGEGYGSRFSAVSAERALPHLMDGDKEALLQRERVTSEVIERISSLAEAAESAETAPEELIQILRSSRASGLLYERLQLEAEESVDLFTKAPLFMAAGNPAQAKAQRRGVRYRVLYENAVLEDPGIKPYLLQWIARGEEARVFQGDLPHKLAIFDSQTVLMPLIRPGEQIKTLVIRYPQLAESLRLTFEHLWERSEPIVATARAHTPSTAKSRVLRKHRVNRNGGLRQSPQK
jgi:sugar-specific transcriptional regulator TrmB